MSNLKSSYEAMVILSLKQGQEFVENTVQKLKELIESNAVVDNIDQWGKRRLAYEINKEKEAYYVLFNFTSEAKFPSEFERICRITDGVLRSIVIKKES